MKVIGYNAAGNADTLEIIEMDQPVVGPRDLLVAVEGISVNPVDVKLRAGVEPDGAERVLGFDAAGVVTEIGNEVTGYKVGDAVYYAGDVTRAGTNAEFHAVDERIVGRKPASLDFADAAGLPLTSITAWEMLFDAFRLTEGGRQWPDATGHRRCRRGGLDFDPTRQGVDQPYGYCNCLAARNAGLGAQDGGGSRGGPPWRSGCASG